MKPTTQGWRPAGDPFPGMGRCSWLGTPTLLAPIATQLRRWCIQVLLLGARVRPTASETRVSTVAKHALDSPIFPD